MEDRKRLLALPPPMPSGGSGGVFMSQSCLTSTAITSPPSGQPPGTGQTSSPNEVNSPIGAPTSTLTVSLFVHVYPLNSFRY